MEQSEQLQQRAKRMKELERWINYTNYEGSNQQVAWQTNVDADSSNTNAKT